MGATESTKKVYARFEGEAKAGESRAFRHVLNYMKPTDAQDMLTELEYPFSSTKI